MLIVGHLSGSPVHMVTANQSVAVAEQPKISRTILVVESHDLLRTTLRQWLEVMLPGCQVIEAAGRQQIDAVVQDDLPEVVIVDIGLPGVVGLETLKYIRQTMPRIPIVALASFDSDTGRTHALTDGANIFLEKRSMLSELQPTLIKLMLSQSPDS